MNPDRSVPPPDVTLLGRHVIALGQIQDGSGAIDESPSAQGVREDVRRIHRAMCAAPVDEWDSHQMVANTSAFRRMTPSSILITRS